MKTVLDFVHDPVVLPRLLKVPASTAMRFHHAWEGGLLEHIVDVMVTAEAVCSSLPAHSFATRRTDVFLAALIHDIHKIGDAHGVENFIPNILKSGKQSDAIPYASNPGVNLFHVFIAGGPGSKDPADRMQEQGAHVLMRCIDLMPEGELSLGLVRAISPALYDILSDDVKFAVRHHDGMYGPARRELAGKETPLMLVLHFADMVSSRRGKWMEGAK